MNVLLVDELSVADSIAIRDQRSICPYPQGENQYFPNWFTHLSIGSTYTPNLSKKWLKIDVRT